MSDRRHDPWRVRFDDLKEAYALGALSENERREFESYLEAHPELQAEVVDLESIAHLLALAPQEYEPSPELRRNILSRIEDEGASISELPPPSARSSRRRVFGPGGFAAAAVAAVAVVAVVGLFLWNSSLRDTNEDLRGELETRQTHELQGSGEAQDARGEVVELGGGRAVLVAENLPSTPEDKVYEAWVIRDNMPEPAGIFEASAEGDTAAPVEGSLNGAEAVAVTLEPDGGSSMPTSEPLLTAAL